MDACAALPPAPAPPAEDGSPPSVLWVFVLEILMLSCALVVAFLTVIRTYAHRSSPLHYAITMVSRLSLPFITYTINTAEDARGSVSPLFVVSAVTLHLIYSKINISVAGDQQFFGARREDIWSNLFPAGEVVGLVWIGFLLLSSGKAIPKRLKIPTCVIIGLSIIQVTLNYLSLYYASSSLAVGKNAKLVRSYMAKNPGKMLVKGEEKQTIVPVKSGGYSITQTKEADLITVDDVLSYCERDDGKQIRDLCISFALFKVMRARLEAGPHQPPDESSAHNSMRRLLLQNEGEDSYRSMFRVVERELAFLNDYLYSTLPFAYHRWFPLLNIIVLILLLTSCLSLIVIVIYESFVGCHPSIHVYYKSLHDDQNAVYVKHLFLFDVLVCVYILMAPVGMDAWEIFTYLSSDWVRVALFCKQVKYQHKRKTCRLPSLLQKALHHICRFNTKDIVRPNSWSNKLSQRCILKPIATKSVNVPDAVKEDIFDYLAGCDGRLSNGSVPRYKKEVPAVGYDEEFADACWMESHTERMLVWHIATSLCEDQHSDQAAACLSRYCFYLAAEHPEVMGTDDTEWVTKIVQDVANQFVPNDKVRGSTQFFCKSKPVASDQEGGQSAEAMELARMGRELGSRLMNIDEKQRWAMLAGVWIEMVMCLAAAGDIASHTRLLGQGGEFITHVWALLYHLGIN